MVGNIIKQKLKIDSNDSADTIIYTPFKELMRIVLFSFIILLLITPFVFASSQALTYDSTTNELNMSYDSLNRVSTKNSSTENRTYTYDDEYYGTLTNVTFNSDSYEYEYDERLRVAKEVRIIGDVTFIKRNYHDSMGRLIKQDFSPGKNITYYYDGGYIKICNWNYADWMRITYRYNASAGIFDEIILDNDYNPLCFLDNANLRNSASAMDIRIRASGVNKQYFDMFFARKFVDVPPTVLIGAEEEIFYENEAQARASIEQGIQNALGSVTIYTDQQIYTRNLTNDQQLGTFDKAVASGSKRWAFNYITVSESYTYMTNMTPVFYVWENTNMSGPNIISSVSNFITQTS